MGAEPVSEQSPNGVQERRTALIMVRAGFWPLNCGQVRLSLGAALAVTCRDLFDPES